MIKSSDHSFKQNQFVTIEKLTIIEETETYNKKKGNYNNNILKYCIE